MHFHELPVFSGTALDLLALYVKLWKGVLDVINRAVCVTMTDFNSGKCKCIFYSKFQQWCKCLLLVKRLPAAYFFFYEKTIDAEAKPKLIRPMRTTPSAYVPQILGKSLYSPNDVTDN